MTVRQHIEFPLKSPRHSGMSSEEKKAAIEQAVSCTGLKPYENRLLGNFPEVSVKGLPWHGPLWGNLQSF